MSGSLPSLGFGKAIASDAAVQPKIPTGKEGNARFQACSGPETLC